MNECNDCDQTPDKCHYNCNNCESAVWVKDCQSCLQSHDRKLKEALDSDSRIVQDVFVSFHIKDWLQFWKERGIK